jgi:hypothetical protein
MGFSIPRLLQVAGAVVISDEGKSLGKNLFLSLIMRIFFPGLLPNLSLRLIGSSPNFDHVALEPKMEELFSVS